MAESNGHLTKTCLDHAIFIPQHEHDYFEAQRKEKKKKKIQIKLNKVKVYARRNPSLAYVTE